MFQNINEYTIQDRKKETVRINICSLSFQYLFLIFLVSENCNLHNYKKWMKLKIKNI